MKGRPSVADDVGGGGAAPKWTDEIGKKSQTKKQGRDGCKYIFHVVYTPLGLWAGGVEEGVSAFNHYIIIGV